MLQFTAKPDVLRAIVDILSTIVEEARMVFDQDKVQIRVVDASHVALIEMEVDAAAFEAWNADETTLGLELQKMRDLVSLAGSDDLIDFTYDEALGSVNMVVGDVDRTIRPLDHSIMKNPRVPDLELKNKTTIQTSKFNRALKAAKQVGDLVTLSLDRQQFSLHVSNDQDSVTVSHEAGQLVALECDSPVKSTYSIGYLAQLIARVDGLTESIDVLFDDKMPLRIEFTFADGAGRMIYFLAPRIEDA